MKKITFALLAALPVLLSSCSDEEAVLRGKMFLGSVMILIASYITYFIITKVKVRNEEQ